MIDNNIDAAERFFCRVALVLLGIFLFLLAIQQQQYDTDIFWALKSGEWILANMSVPTTDPFSYTFAGREWVDFTWGFQVIAYSVFTWCGGWYGLAALQFIITSLTFYILYRNLRLLGLGQGVLLAALLFMVFACSEGRYFIRPHLFAYLFISCCLLLLNIHSLSKDKTKARLALWALLPLQLLWVNIHSSFILGIFIVGIYVMGRIFEELRAGKGLRGLSSGCRALIIVSLLVPLVSVINPYGVKLVLFPFIHQGGENAETLLYIGEWTRLPLRSLFLDFYPVPLGLLVFKLMVVGGLGIFFINRRKVSPRDLVLFFTFMCLAISHIRWVAVFSFVAIPVIAFNASGTKFVRERLLKVASALLVLCFVGYFFYGIYGKGVNNYAPGLKKGYFPEGMVSFIKSEGLEGNIFNGYSMGGYFVFNNIRVFIDGRTPTVYSPYHFWTHRIAREPGVWKRLVKEHEIDIAFVKPGSKLCENLYKDEDWITVGLDDVSVLYLRDINKFRRAIEDWGNYGDVSLCETEESFVLPSEEDVEALRGFKYGLEKLIAFYKDSEMDTRISRPWRLLGLANMRLGDSMDKGKERDGFIEEARDAFLRAREVVDSPELIYDLAISYEKLGEPDDKTEARRLFRESQSVGFTKAYLTLGLLDSEEGNHKEATKALKKYEELKRDETEYSAYNALGLSCFELGDMVCAIRYLKRAAFTGEEPKSLANIYYKLGSAYMLLGEIDDAVASYERAVESEPEYALVLRSLAVTLSEQGEEDGAAAIRELLARQ